jgi:hypothetical protein
MSHLASLSRTQLRIGLALLLGFAFVLLQLTANVAPPVSDTAAWPRDEKLHVFFHPDCPHCHRAIEFLRAQPRVDFDLHDVSNAANKTLLIAIARERAVPANQLGVPFFVRGSRYLIGFESADTTGGDLLALVSDSTAIARPEEQSTTVRLPLVGAIDAAGYSLPVLAVLMGLADGFNPCAMWVLVYLISLIAGLRDRGKVWWLVGSFVLASGILYFLFMTAWLNTFLVVGYIRPLTQIIGLAAIGFGIDHLYELAVTRGAIVCEVDGAEQRHHTMQRIRHIVAAPVGLASLLLVIGLAFTVNAIEFVCSAALPAIYTHALALAELSTSTYYAYMALYVLFFMLDDLVVFGFAAFAVQKMIDTRYAAFSRGIGGAVLIGLGVWMLART